MRGVIKGGAAAIGVSAMITAAIIVPQFEGIRLKPYRDAAGIWTVCMGHTKTTVPGESKTLEECANLMEEDLWDAAVAVDDLVEVDIPENTRAALISFVFNLGRGSLARSTLLEKLNAGDIEGACNELPRWVHADGERLRGLVKRRKLERQLCLRDVE